ncbi:GNAT family N-acetyltransferase [Alkalihalobacillus sp. TS-13]|uniref:GNAT family N-acetyltransferase n=1 Tax=Alkalihalobacillus sp. TS-13 TaxID=2842455 RepID=UPI001C88C271|nr:GNAT family N-acetyltransferase [Alkalihalobacillus sp. TS-13]
MREQSDKYSGLVISLSRKTDGFVSLDLIQVSPRHKGVGTEVMQALIHQADKYGDNLKLYPSDDYGSDFDRLKKWYERFGFRSNGDWMFRYAQGDLTM